jgi:hypothetical protein
MLHKLKILQSNSLHEKLQCNLPEHRIVDLPVHDHCLKHRTFSNHKLNHPMYQHEKIPEIQAETTHILPSPLPLLEGQAGQPVNTVPPKTTPNLQVL